MSATMQEQLDDADKKRPCATLHLHRSQLRVGYGFKGSLVKLVTALEGDRK